MKLMHVKLFLLVLALTGSQAFARPYFAVRHGYKCSQCHVNRTGGGKRNDFGVIYSQTVLPMIKVGESSFFHNELSEFVSLGANVRMDNKTVLKKQSKETNTFTFPEGNLYLETALIKEKLALYFDENFAPTGASSREAIGIWNQLPWNGYIKAGRFLLPYGWRVLDNTAFIRSRTNINYNEQDYGLEIGLEPGAFSGNIALSNGTSGGDDDNTNKQITSRLEFVFRHFRLGSSAGFNRSLTNKRQMAGLFLGANVWKLTWLGEGDYIFDKDLSVTPISHQDKIALYSQLNFLITPGLNLQFVYEWLDPDTTVDNDNRIRFVSGVEWYITQFLQGGLFYRVHEGPPQRPTESEDEFIGQIHLFF